jgi:hypothetical protein
MSPEESLLMAGEPLHVTPWIREGKRLVRVSADTFGLKEEEEAA